MMLLIDRFQEHVDQNQSGEKEIAAMRDWDEFGS